MPSSETAKIGIKNILPKHARNPIAKASKETKKIILSKNKRKVSQTATLADNNINRSDELDGVRDVLNVEFLNDENDRAATGVKTRKGKFFTYIFRK